MSDPTRAARDLNDQIDRRVHRILAETFGGSPGVYTNLNATLDRTGRITFASGGGEVGFDWQGGTAGNGTIHYVAPYRMAIGTAVQASDGTPTITYGVSIGGTGAFSGTAPPFVLNKRDVVRVICAGLAGTAQYAAVTLVRQTPGTAV